MKIILFIMFLINRIRCKYGCGDNEEWRNYEIDMYDDTWHYKTFSRNPPVYTIHLFQLKDRGSTVWSITKVGAIKPHTGSQTHYCERMKLIHLLTLCNVVIYRVYMGK